VGYCLSPFGLEMPREELDSLELAGWSNRPYSP
jgi:hypothetical protein